MFAGRLPARSRLAPWVVETEEGHEVWEFDGNVYFQVGLNVVVGRKREDWKVEPTRFNEMRPGCFDIEPRIRDMDINGVWALVNFPSQITGFCGSVFSRCSDPELGLAVTQAWNDWFHDEWYSAHPDRIVPMGITYLADADQGAAEIRRNAARGFTAVTLPEMPHRIGMEPIFSSWWDPIIAACAETGTVICLHVGSTGVADMPRGAPMVPARRDALRPALAVGLRGVAVVGLRSEAPGARDRDERGRHRLGGDAARPAREHRRPFGLRRLLPGRHAPGRGLAPQLLVLDHRRSLDPRDPSHDRRRSHRVRVRLSARRRDVARHAAGVRCSVRRAAGDEIAKISHENAAHTVPPPAPTAGKPTCDRSATVSDYETLLRDAYIGEIFGDALFGALADAQPMRTGARSCGRCRPSRPHRNQSAETRRERRDEARAADPKACDDGRKLAATLDVSHWTAFVHLLHDSLPPFVEKFERLRGSAAYLSTPPCMCSSTTSAPSSASPSSSLPATSARSSRSPTTCASGRVRRRSRGALDEREFGSSLDALSQFVTNCTTATMFPRMREQFFPSSQRKARAFREDKHADRAVRAGCPGGGSRMPGEATLTVGLKEASGNESQPCGAHCRSSSCSAVA